MADATPRSDGGFLWNTSVRGPVRSRRLGRSLGLNLLPARSKLCDFDCPYCECGFRTPRAPAARWPSPDEIAHSLRRALQNLAAPPDAITFSGNGEPTLHPRFPVVVDRVLAARDELAPRTPVAILSNGVAAIGSAATRAALLRLDRRMMKLDLGPAERVNGSGYDAGALADAYRAIAPVTLQAMVARGRDWDGSSDAALAAWLPAAGRADPAAVHLYSLARPPADGSVKSVARERLDEMARA
ncbi:MAG TPA: radical SAM protein, partial [Gemmatimonadales bacterium]|nr:radical SAM protein [Gemmatimonadales bacterium]